MAASTVTKQDIVTAVSERTGLPQQRVMDVVQATFDCMSDLLAKGNRIEIRNFGVFDVKVKRARMGRILATMQPIEIPSRAVVRFKPGKEMREIVANKATAVLSAKLPPPAPPAAQA
jgi:DNA-binding protein HU-beta/integration host factor subunit alpha